MDENLRNLARGGTDKMPACYITWNHPFIGSNNGLERSFISSHSAMISGLFLFSPFLDSLKQICNLIMLSYHFLKTLSSLQNKFSPWFSLNCQWNTLGEYILTQKATLNFIQVGKQFHRQKAKILYEQTLRLFLKQRSTYLTQ